MTTEQQPSPEFEKLIQEGAEIASKMMGGQIKIPFAQGGVLDPSYAANFIGTTMQAVNTMRVHMFILTVVTEQLLEKHPRVAEEILANTGERLAEFAETVKQQAEEASEPKIIDPTRNGMNFPNSGRF